LENLFAEALTISSIPAPTLKRFIDNYSKLGEGELGEDILRLLNYSNYQIEGPKKKETKKPKSIEEQNAEFRKEQEKKNRQSRQLENSLRLGPQSQKNNPLRLGPQSQKDNELKLGPK